MALLIKVGSIVTVNPYGFDRDCSRDCIIGKEYTVIPYSSEPEYAEYDADHGGCVTLVDERGAHCTVDALDVTVVNKGE